MIRRVLLGMSLCAFCAVAGCDDDDVSNAGDGGSDANDAAFVGDAPALGKSDAGTAPDGASTSKLDAAATAQLDAAAPAAAECSAPCYVKFLQTVQSCIPSGSCTTSATAEGGVNLCYANGVKSSLSQQLVLRTYKTSGALCYSTILDPDTGEGEYVDASGAVLGTVVDNAGQQSILTCAGQSFNLTTLECAGQAVGPMADADEDCTAGVCTVP
jgi:hypothetical protein